MRCAPSLLAANFAALESELVKMDAAGADWLHLDVMDGAFVPPISFGELMVSTLRPRCRLPFDVHLMVQRPADKIAAFAAAGADWITFHIEAEVHAHRLLAGIRAAGCKAGVSLVPSTPVATLTELLTEVDLILVMTVNPGYGGQTLLPSCLHKVRELRRMRQQGGHHYLISVDGGINRETALLACQAGADIAVSGSSFFGAPDPAAYCRYVQQLQP